jgi:hypothetical protein
MLEAAQRGAFDRGRLRVERVDLDHPAVTVEFVGVLRQSKRGSCGCQLISLLVATAP